MDERPRLILASRSPQRRAILEQLGVRFEVRPADVEELAHGDAREVALENAMRKASAAGSGASGELVLGVDTVVELGGALHGKPLHEDAARATLAALSGETHTVVSAVALWRGAADVRTSVTATEVTFRELDERTLAWYVRSGEWRGRAGAYAIQGRGAALVRAIEGDYLNVVGLPLAALLELWPGLLALAL
jgi:septum formation protein